ncbi:MAG: hypothetical protein ACOCTT_00430 [archaeon]
MLNKIKEELEKNYQKREKVLKKRRNILPLCQEGVKCIHNNEFEKAEKKRKKAQKILNECESELKESPVLKDKALGISYQEYAELCILKEYLEKRNLPKIDIPPKYYLTGLGDAIGELKRHTMDKLGEGNIKEAEEIEEELEKLYTKFKRFSYPNSIVPNLKRKQDVARKVLNDLHDNIISAKI